MFYCTIGVWLNFVFLTHLLNFLACTETTPVITPAYGDWETTTEPAEMAGNLTQSTWKVTSENVTFEYNVSTAVTVDYNVSAEVNTVLSSLNVTDLFSLAPAATTEGKLSGMTLLVYTG